MTEASNTANPQPPEEAYYMVQLPDGEQMTLDEALMKERGTAQAELDLNLLQAGDLLAMQYGEEGHIQAEIFDVQEAFWTGLGASMGRPRKALVGKLSGPLVSDDVEGRSLRLAGSGWGGSSKSDSLATSRRPYYVFARDGRRVEYKGSVIDDFEVFRRNDDGLLTEQTPNQLAGEMRTDSEVHLKRMAAVDALIEAIGLDDYDVRNGHLGPDQKDRWELENGRFMVEANLRAFQGNELNIYDKEAQQWFNLHYFNAQNEDVLKISTGDATGVTLESYEHIITSSNLSRASKSIVTFTSSEQHGLRAIDYQLGNAAAQEVGVPEYWNDGLQQFQPTTGEIIIIEGQDKLRFQPDLYLHLIDKANPGTVDKIQDQLGRETDDEGNHYISINGRALQRIPDPVQLLQELAANIKQSVSAGQ